MDGWLDDSEEHITDHAVASSSARVLPENTVLMAMYGATVGQLGILRRPMTCNQACCAMIVDPSQADYRYLFYKLLHDRPHIKRLSTGAAQQNLSGQLIKSLKFSFPSLSEQRAIAHILGTLDDKIELNRRMNQTLEEMARALFKSWFVEFDPVRAKAALKQHALHANDPDTVAASDSQESDWTVERARAYLDAMDPQIADLFPDRLVPSELGEIPEGWEIGKLSDIVIRHRENEHPGESPDTVFSHFSIPAYDEGQAPKQELGKEIKSGKSQVPPGVVLVSKLNPEIERVWLVNVTADDNAICSTEFLVLEARRPFTQSYVYCLARSPLFRQQINTLVTGTSKSHQRAPANAVLSLDTVVPNISLVEAFDMSASEFLSRTLRCRSEARDLAEQRDTLLSKLLTGALPVREVVS